MIAWKKAYEKHPIFIGLTIFLMVIISMQLTLSNGGASLLNPALGLALVFAWVFGKETYPSIGFGAFFGQFFMRFFIYDIPVMQSLFLSIFLTLVLMMQVEVAIRLAKRYNLGKSESYFSLKTATIFIVISLFVALLGAYFGNVSLIITSVTTESYTRSFMIYGFGDLMGIFIMVPSGILGYKHDKELFDDTDVYKLLKTGLFFIVFVWLTILLSNNIGFFDFARHKYLVILFYISIGFLFSYRMIHYFSLTFILFSSIFYSARIGSDPLLMFYVSLILFLSFSTMITIFIKRFHDIKMQQANELEEKNAALDLLLTEVYALLELSSDIIDSEGAAEKSYLKRTFDIAYKLFKGCHAGYCYQVIDGSIEVIDTRVYKTNEIPYVYETNQIIDNDHDTLFVFPNFKDTLKKTFGNQFGILDEDQYPLLGRTVMPLYYQDNEAFIIVLDRFTKQTSIDERHIERLKHFSLLLDGLYKRNYFVLRNTNLKDEVVLSIVRTLELFDPYTKGHSEDVAALSVELAKHVNNDPAFISELYWAGILHDIGKVGVDGKIIRKPDKLTKEEYEQVKRHTHYGYNVLAEANSLSPIASIVKHHHEWYSGGGYPDGLKDEAIPLASRIISVVDMVATMATDRPYRKRQNKPEIIAELTKWKGIQFDPDLVDKMISLIENNILEGHFKRNYH